VGSLLWGALSWLPVVTVGLAPMLVYWLARVIGQALRHKDPGPQAGEPPGRRYRPRRKASRRRRTRV
jgi:hypothetical protein